MLPPCFWNTSDIPSDASCANHDLFPSVSFLLRYQEHEPRPQNRWNVLGQDDTKCNRIDPWDVLKWYPQKYLTWDAKRTVVGSFHSLECHRLLYILLDQSMHGRSCIDPHEGFV